MQAFHVPFGVDDHLFELNVNKYDTGRNVCTSSDSVYLPLCRAVETAWLYGPHSFLDSVSKRQGASFEGEVGYAFDHEYPEEIVEGVALFYFDQEITVSIPFFVRFVAAFAEAACRIPEAFDLSDTEVQEIRTQCRQLLASQA